MDDNIELTYRITEQLLRKYRKTLKWSLRSKATMAVVAVGVPLLAIFGIFYSMGSVRTFTGKSVAEYMLVGVLIGYASQLIYYRVNRMFIRNRYQNALSSQDEIAVKLDASGIEIKDSLSKTNFTWSAVKDVVEFSYGIGINLMDTQFMPVPTDALPDGVTKEDALSRINSWRTA